MTELAHVQHACNVQSVLLIFSSGIEKMSEGRCMENKDGAKELEAFHQTDMIPSEKLT